MDQTGATVAIQGFGKVGYWAAVALENMGMKVEAISDVSGGIKGFKSIQDLHEYVSENGEIKGYPHGDFISNEELLHLDVDVLIPAALAEAINSKTAEQVKAKIVVEGANSPTSPEADKILSDKGVLLIPDILANSGGVIVSYFEWVQDNQDYYWTADEVRQNLDRMLMKALTEVKELVAATGRSWREAALMIGVGRVAEAHRLRGLYP
jgi:glutamate dehydrogenase (NAD(P)+)